MTVTGPGLTVIFFIGCFHPMADVGYPPSVKKDAVPHRPGYQLSCQRNGAVVSRWRADGTQDLQNRMFCDAWPAGNFRPLTNQIRRSAWSRWRREESTGGRRNRS